MAKDIGQALKGAVGTPGGGRSGADSVGAQRGPVLPLKQGPHGLGPLAGRVSLSGGVLGERQETNALEGLEHGWRMLSASGTLANFAKAAGAVGFGYCGQSYSDSDVYKWLEAVSWQEQRGLTGAVAHAADGVLALLESAQLPDGYLNSYVQAAAHAEKWAEVNRHEFYNLGHLVQAGVASARSGGNGRLFRIALRALDQLERACVGKANTWNLGHPGIEMALVEFYRTTGDKRYLELGERLLEFRGERKDVLVGSGLSEWEDVLLPMPWEPALAGHAVCAAYLAAGMTDLFAELGDERVREAVEAKWQDMVLRKSYITGNIGSRHAGEAVGIAYELPSGRSYCETCAGVGLLMWCWRLLLLRGEPLYADYFEKVLYNSVLCGVGLDGKRFFYANPLEDEGDIERSPWYSCPCCPTNVMRLLAQLEHYIATQDSSGVQIHQFASARIATMLEHAGVVELLIETKFPNDGKMSVRIEEPGTAEWELSLRVPSWCPDEPVVVLNGEAIVPDSTPRQGYVNIRRGWSTGDQVFVEFKMRPRFVEADWRSHDQRGMVAVMRGPIVYCAESHDQKEGVDLKLLEVSPSQGLVESLQTGVLGEYVGLRARMRRVNYETEEPLYHTWDPSKPSGIHAQSVDVDEDLWLIPYFLWANRGKAAMRVWFDAAAHMTERGFGVAGQGV